MARNLLLGHGENLITDLPRPSGHGGTKRHPYTSKDEVYARLTPQANAMSERILAMDNALCPGDNSVFKLILHPAYTAKTWFPAGLLHAFKLRVVGSKYVRIIPQKRLPSLRSSKNNEPEYVSALELFVAGKRLDISSFSKSLEQADLFEQVRRIESISAFDVGERIIGDVGELEQERIFELVLHASRYEDVIVSSFVELAKKNGISTALDHRVHSSRLCFLPLKVKDFKSIQAVESFSFLRLVRRMPRLREITRDSIGRSVPVAMAQLPPCSQSERGVAVLDIGSESSACLNGWVRRHDLPRKFSSGDKPLHGTLVNSALLFGPIGESCPLKPIAPVDSYQVVDPADSSSGFELYEALDRICDILDSDRHEFVNLSIGPDLPISDDEVHVWTARLDEKLASGKVLMTVAVGNNGECDEESGNARIEVPGDSVNALCVGASSDFGEHSGWDKAAYSAIGPGRMPGKIKPDILDFGGSDDNGFRMLDPVRGCLVSGMGTSFAAPNALRKCVALKKKYPELNPLAIKALLVHFACKKSHGHDDMKHGHGALASEIDRFVVCDENEMSVVYQGNLDPQKYVKVPIPVPKKLTGRVKVRVTLCFATSVNAESPGNYTKSAIEVLLRPDAERPTKDSLRPKTTTFFDSKKYASEDELRREGLKWSTVMSGEKGFDADATIEEPFLELHYTARDGVERGEDSSLIPYALVITIKAPKTPDIYEKVLARYRNQIRPIVEQQVQVPVEV